jgi:hypothetical protein
MAPQYDVSNAQQYLQGSESGMKNTHEPGIMFSGSIRGNDWCYEGGWREGGEWVTEKPKEYKKERRGYKIPLRVRSWTKKSKVEQVFHFGEGEGLPHECPRV